MYARETRGLPFGQFINHGPSAINANEAAFTRYRSPGLLINRIGMNISTSSGNVDLGVYADGGAGTAPGARLVSTGSQASPGTGGQVWTIPATIIPEGLIWLAFAVDNGTFQVRYGASSVGSFDPDTATTVLTKRQSTAFPLPSTASIGGSTYAIAPVIWVDYA